MAIIIDKNDLKETLTEIFREINQPSSTPPQGTSSPNPRELMTLAQAAEYLQCSIQSVKNWSQRSKDKNPLPYCNAGADPRFYKSEIDAWLIREKIVREKRKAASN